MAQAATSSTDDDRLVARAERLAAGRPPAPGDLLTAQEALERFEAERGPAAVTDQMRAAAERIHAAELADAAQRAQATR